MPTVITVPVGERTKSIKFGATYTPNLSFNPDKKLFFGCSGVLTGMGITVDTVPTPDEVTVDPGAFIQRGIIVDVTNPQLLQFPDPLPIVDLFLTAENPSEVFNSSVTLQFTTAPAADSVIIAQWAAPITTTVFTTELKLGICELRDAIDGVLNFVIQRDRQVASGGQMIFTLPAGKEYELGANKLSIYRNGKRLDSSQDYMEDNPNQITLNFGAIAGDVLEFIIIQSEPPITSIALTNLTDVTGDLANAIKDTSALRTLATAANPLATLADIPGAIVNGIQLIATSQVTTVFADVTDTVLHNKGLTNILPDPNLDFTFATSRFGSRRFIHGYTCDQGRVIIDSKLIDLSFFITVDPRISGAYIIQGAVTAGTPGGIGLTLNDVTLRYDATGGRGTPHAFSWLTQVWLVAPGLL
jgi:hypothetical protein